MTGFWERWVTSHPNPDSPGSRLGGFYSVAQMASLRVLVLRKDECPSF